MPIKWDKSDPPVKLTKEAGGILVITLSWDDPNVDLDLGCMYELTDGTTPKVIQALDKDFGSLSQSPYIALSGDARGGGSQEVLKVNLGRADAIKRALPFAYIYPRPGQKVNDWRLVGRATVTVKHPTQGEYVTDLATSSGRTCALLNLVDEGGPDGLVMQRLDEYFAGFHPEVDRHYGWPNIDWHDAMKDD